MDCPAARQDLKEKLEISDHKESPDHEVLLAHKEHKEILDLQVLWVKV
jgi:hypothetical protein